MSSASTIVEPSRTTVRRSASIYGNAGAAAIVPVRIGESSATTVAAPLPVVNTAPVGPVPLKKNRTGPGVELLASEVTLAAPSGIHFEIAWLLRPKIGSIWVHTRGLLIAAYEGTPVAWVEPIGAS